MSLEVLHASSLQYLSNQKIEYRRYLWNLINHDEKLIGIIGARGVGKTTYILQYLQSLKLPIHKKLYISADSIEIANRTLLDIAKEFAAHGGEVLAIDEIHKYNGFEVELKQIHDMLDLRLIFSGSSAINLEHSKADLSRRAMLYRVNGLSYREFLEIKLNCTLTSYSLDQILSSHIDIVYRYFQGIKPLEHWQEYLECGFYPFYFQNKESYNIKLNETINTVIEVDIPSLFKIRYENINNLKKLTKLICSSKPFKLNIKELSSKIGVDRDTLYHYMEYLHRGKVLNILRSRSKGDNIFLKPDKIYLNNPNLNYSYCEEQEIGTIRETFFLNQLNLLHSVYVSTKGDFIVDNQYTFEIGGKNKGYEQIKDTPDSFVVADNIEIGFGNKIPLWLFGFLY